jgi:hypothetical protein
VSAARKPKPRRGDVVHVEVGEPTDPVKIRLHGHPFTYSVLVALTETGPQLGALEIAADEGAVVDYEALRAVPARRLAYTAAQAIERKFAITAGGEPERVPEIHGRIEKPSTAYLAANIANIALALGLPVRPTVAARLGVSKTTVDRLLKRAKAEGWFADRPLPKRPPPRQRDTTE